MRQDYDHGAKAAAGTVTPVPAMRPSGHGADENEDEDYDEDGDHTLESKRPGLADAADAAISRVEMRRGRTAGYLNLNMNLNLNFLEGQAGWRLLFEAENSEGFKFMFKFMFMFKWPAAPARRSSRLRWCGRRGLLAPSRGRGCWRSGTGMWRHRPSTRDRDR